MQKYEEDSLIGVAAAYSGTRLLLRIANRDAGSREFVITDHAYGPDPVRHLLSPGTEEILPFDLS